MATVTPFCALHPTSDCAVRVAAVPYDVVNVEEARVLAKDNPLSFLHVSRAEIDLPAGADPYSDPVYRAAAARFEALARAAPLVRDETPCVYVYRLRAGGHEQTGIAACYSLDEYDADLIKKHERTRRDKEDDRTRHIVALRAQTGPVFLTYRALPAIDEAVALHAAGAPLFDFEAADGVRHTIWRVSGPPVDAIVRAFARVPALYIADGHHRAASAARARQELGASSVSAATFLAVAFPENQVRILPYNRVVKDLGGRSPEALLSAVRARFTVKDGQPTPSRKGHVSMYLAGAWHTIDLDVGDRGPGARDRGSTDPRSPIADPRKDGDVIGTLDVSVLQERLLEPILGIGDVRSDRRIDFIGGDRGAKELERLVNEGWARVAFSMFPVSVGELISIADAGKIMPPKSTWFEPKLRDGLLVHEL